MAEVKRIGRKYFIEFLANGLRYQKYAGTSIKEAHAIQKQIEESIADQNELTKERYISFQSFFDDYLRKINRSYSARSVKRFHQTCNHFLNYILGQDDIHYIQDIVPRVMEGYKQVLISSYDVRSCTHDRRIINLNLFILDRVFFDAVKEGLINESPLLHIPYLRSIESQYQNIDRQNLGRFWDTVKSLRPFGKLLSINSLQKALDRYKGPAFVDTSNIIKLRNQLIAYLFSDNVPYNRISEQIYFTDIARWTIFLEHIPKVSS
jgi:hypothetical protein